MQGPQARAGVDPDLLNLTATAVVVVGGVVQLARGRLTRARALALAGGLTICALFSGRDFISDPVGTVIGFSGAALVLFGLVWDLFTGSGWANGESRRFARPTRVLLVLANSVTTMSVLAFAALVRDGSTTIYLDPYAEFGKPRLRHGAARGRRGRRAGAVERGAGPTGGDAERVRLGLVVDEPAPAALRGSPVLRRRQRAARQGEAGDGGRRHRQDEAEEQQPEDRPGDVRDQVVHVDRAGHPQQDVPHALTDLDGGAHGEPDQGCRGHRADPEQQGEQDAERHRHDDVEQERGRVDGDQRHHVQQAAQGDLGLGDRGTDEDVRPLAGERHAPGEEGERHDPGQVRGRDEHGQRPRPGQRPPVAEREQPDDDHADQQRQQHGAGVELGDERSGQGFSSRGGAATLRASPGPAVHTSAPGP